MNSSEDESDSDSGSGRGLGEGPTQNWCSQAVGQSARGHRMEPGSGRGQVTECVQELCGRGYGEELQWLEAYLADEARDRTLDGT